MEALLANTLQGNRSVRLFAFRPQGFLFRGGPSLLLQRNGELRLSLGQPSIARERLRRALLLQVFYSVRNDGC